MHVQNQEEYHLKQVQGYFCSDASIDGLNDSPNPEAPLNLEHTKHLQLVNRKIVHWENTQEVDDESTFQIVQSDSLWWGDLMTISEKACSKAENDVDNEYEINEVVDNCPPYLLSEGRMHSNLDWNHKAIPGGKNHNYQVPS